MQFSHIGRKHTDSAAGRTVAACGRQGGKPGTTLPVIPSGPRFLVRLIFGKYPRKNRIGGACSGAGRVSEVYETKVFKVLLLRGKRPGDFGRCSTWNKLCPQR